LPSRVLLALAAAVLVLATGVVADARTTATGTLVFALAGDGARDTSEIVSAQPDMGRFTWLTRHRRPSGWNPRWTADGRRIVFWNSPLRGDVADAIWRMTARGTQFTRLPGGCCFDVPSPDARRVAVCAQDALELWSAGGRRLRTLARGSCGTQPAWSPKGRYVAAAVSATGVDGYARTFVFRTDGPMRAWALTGRRADMEPDLIAWAPDSRRLLIAGPREGVFTSTLDAVSFDGKRRKRLLRGLGYHPEAVWSADGRSIAFVGPAGGVYVLPSSGGARRQIARTRERYTSDIRLDWSPRSDVVAFSDLRGISIVPATGGRVRRLTARGAESGLDWSPGGSAIVFNDHSDIDVVNARSRRVRQLTRWVWDDRPSVSGDGSQIAFVRARGDDLAHVSVYVMRRGGSAVRRLGRGYLPNFSRDGRYVVYVDASGSPDPVDARELRVGRIVVANIAGRTRSAIGVGTTPTWSPDGEQIAYMRYEFEEDAFVNPVSSDLWVRRRDGSEPRVVFRAHRLFDPRWSPDGRTIAAETSGVDDFALIDVATGTARIIDTDGLGAFAWSADSRRVAALTLNGLEIFDTETGTTRTVLEDDHTCWPSSLAWSPNATEIAYIHCTESRSSGEVRVVRIDGTGLRRIARPGASASDLQWWP